MYPAVTPIHLVSTLGESLTMVNVSHFSQPMKIPSSFHIQECIYTDKKPEREAANKVGPKLVCSLVNVLFTAAL